MNGTTQVTDNGQTIQFTPSAQFQNNALIQVFLDATAQDVDGSSLTAYQGSFTTAVDTTTVAPTVVSTSPVSGATAVPTGNASGGLVIDIGFNETLSSATVNTTTVTLTQGSNGPLVTATVTLLSGGTIIQIVPSAALAASTTYYFHISSGVQGTNGLSYAGGSFSFMIFRPAKNAQYHKIEPNWNVSGTRVLACEHHFRAHQEQAPRVDSISHLSSCFYGKRVFRPSGWFWPP